MLQVMKRLIVEEQGQGMTEYGLVLGLIAVAVVGALALLRDEIVEMYNNVVQIVTNRETAERRRRNQDSALPSIRLNIKPYAFPSVRFFFH